MTGFWPQLRKGEAGNVATKKRLSKYEMKQQLFSSLIYSEKVESTNLYEMTNKAEKSKDVATITREYEKTI